MQVIPLLFDSVAISPLSSLLFFLPLARSDDGRHLGSKVMVDEVYLFATTPTDGLYHRPPPPPLSGFHNFTHPLWGGFWTRARMI